MELREGGETRLWWSGDSDSTQGGFVLEADLIGHLATLGCDVFGTAYLAEGEDEDEDAMSDGDVGGAGRPSTPARLLRAPLPDTL